MCTLHGAKGLERGLGCQIHEKERDMSGYEEFMLKLDHVIALKKIAELASELSAKAYREYADAFHKTGLPSWMFGLDNDHWISGPREINNNLELIRNEAKLEHERRMKKKEAEHETER